MALAQSWKLANGGACRSAYKVAKQRASPPTEPAKLKEEVKKANIRGRGGAGFPAGVKWGFLNPQPGRPASIWSSTRTRASPVRSKTAASWTSIRIVLIEGAIISCYAIGSHVAYIYVRGELAFSVNRLEEAIAEARQAGYRRGPTLSASSTRSRSTFTPVPARTSAVKKRRSSTRSRVGAGSPD